MADEKLEELVGAIRDSYFQAEGDLQMSSMFGSVGPMSVMDQCKYLIGKVNEIYGTDYKLEEK